MARRVSDAHEEGVTLIEVVVAIFLLAILALALLPSAIGFLKATTTNASMSEATGLVNQQLESARAVTQTCTALQAWAGETLPPKPDNGTVFQPSRATITCPSSYPGTARVSVQVTINGVKPVTGVTLLFVAAAS
ncbi:MULTISPECIES: prepilin-type N-terminal cleavage/methylation domain-containing protein [unclassified Cryobacterium]|uniref:prepilin-type N-terminal cleavage/methylation domain-containing protein n=1 Tax=unclassified Cryobacterium TaxID=2649013 RepID=UPI002AB5B832|nr:MULTISPECIES: prepilin-type N-terminal cleavage/methylation domain-containing protein [unclassified Cryobacterium]MDY7541562.1 prepilin-type N-terminal cleavage/methylation domain-containing protein [Cryobacterium sp. 5B3]MEA9998035.1 prepilin-type N-terminal cleavage/methylation domain-containing protein [Cryobacterium sp. RTS3]MEB0267646.1 prepilin-type N-terminal cleavage/methylation domain-containing protein [Cryobacterium sp. 10I5]MEB0274568.1 prepilin-type N-terminal cleavage/methylati